MLISEHNDEDDDADHYGDSLEIEHTNTYNIHMKQVDDEAELFKLNKNKSLLLL